MPKNTLDPHMLFLSRVYIKNTAVNSLPSIQHKTYTNGIQTFIQARAQLSIFFIVLVMVIESEILLPWL